MVLEFKKSDKGRFKAHTNEKFDPGNETRNNETSENLHKK